MAVDRVGELLRRATHAMDEAGVSYAVVGGNAVAAWVSTKDPAAIRFTKDVDVLIRRRDLPKIAEALKSVDLVQIETLGVTIFADRNKPSPKEGVHIVFAGERIREHYNHPAPDLDLATACADGHKVIDLTSLVKMKLQSFRLVDQTHIVDMKSVGLITDELIAKLPIDLQERLKQIPEPDTH